MFVLFNFIIIENPFKNKVMLLHIMFHSELLQTVRKICAPGKGILAADESIGTIGKRFDAIGIENNHDNRFAYRDLLFQTKGLNQHISGVITYEETLFDEKDGTRLIQPLLDNDIVVGIKVDKGVKPLYHQDETVTQGIDDLDVRCKKYYDAGARFAKWRAVLKIDVNNHLPSDISVHENATTLARYASICIQNGLVPIVEPEILMDGDHNIQTSHDVSVRVLSHVYSELIRHGVDLKCTLLKPNMVRQGVDCKDEIDWQKVGYYTVRAFQQTVPVSMPGVVFLSGGMSELEASIALNEINKYDCAKPWRLTFSYGRALQASVISAWRGQTENIESAQKVLLTLAHNNGLASQGKFEGNIANTDGNTLHESNYVY
jgi:fructose-bisphosphate aldolase class I